MNVGVLVLTEHLFMRFQRIVNFHLGRGAIPSERTVFAGSVSQSDVEIADPLQPACERLSRWQRYCDFDCCAIGSRSWGGVGIDPASLKRESIILFPNAG